MNTVNLQNPGQFWESASRHRWAAGNRLRFAIRGVDVSGGRYGEFGAGGGLFWECGDWFYGTMAGPWWYHTATSVPRVRNLPFSVLRLLIHLTRKPPSCRPCKDRTASLRRPGLLFCILRSIFCIHGATPRTTPDRPPKRLSQICECRMKPAECQETPP